MSKSRLKNEMAAEYELGRLEYHHLMVCSYCRRSLEPPGTRSNLEGTKDHPQPRVKGGTGFTVWACWQCNQTKGSMTYQAWKLFMQTQPNWWVSSKYQRRKEEELEENVLPFKRPMTNLKVITGGQPPSSGNWLLDLPIGTKFTVQSKSDTKNFMCLDLEMVNKTPRTAVLWELSSGQPLGGNGRVVASRFVFNFDFVEQLPSYDEMITPQETAETKDGDSNRTDKLDA